MQAYEETNVLTKDVCCKVSCTQQLLSVSMTITIVEGWFDHTMHGMMSQSSQPKEAEDMDFAAKRQMEKTRARTKVVITTVSNSMDLSSDMSPLKTMPAVAMMKLFLDKRC
jgi:hypothetical protein